MPLTLTPATALPASPYLNLLVLGEPKVGKTTACVGTCPKPALVAKCDPGDALRPALRLSTDFQSAEINSLQDMENLMTVAHKMAKAGEIKTFVVDTLTSLSEMVADECLEANPDGRAAYGDYAKKLSNLCRRIKNLPCHTIMLAHYMDFGQEGSGKGVEKVAKKKVGGEGIAPLLYGKARKIIPSLVDDIVFLEKTAAGRVFVCEQNGVYGPGCRNLAGVETCPADIGELMKLIEKY